MTKDNIVKFAGNMNDIIVGKSISSVFDGKNVYYAKDVDHNAVKASLQEWIDVMKTDIDKHGIHYQPYINLSYDKVFFYKKNSKPEVSVRNMQLNIIHKDIDKITENEQFQKLEEIEHLHVLHYPKIKTTKITVSPDCGFCKAKKLPSPFYYEESSKKSMCVDCEKKVNSAADISQRKELLYIKCEPTSHITKEIIAEFLTPPKNPVECVFCSANPDPNDFYYMNVIDFTFKDDVVPIAFCAFCFNHVYNTPDGRQLIFNLPNVHLGIFLYKKMIYKN